MAPQTKKKVITNGICSFCKGEFEKAKMTQHLKFCKARVAINATAEEDVAKSRERIFHIVAEGRYLPVYWLHFEIPASGTLGDIDSLLRDIWVECCDHLSSFTIDGTSYEDEQLLEDPFAFVDPKYWEQEQNQQDNEEEEEEEEEEELSPDERAQEMGKILDLAYADQPQLMLRSDFETEMRKPHSRDEVVILLKEELKSIPSWWKQPRGTDPEKLRALSLQEDLLKLLLDVIEDRSLDVSLASVLKVGKKFRYEYDFGSTTELDLRVVAEREGVVPDDEEFEYVKLLARNIPPVILCKECGKPATRVASSYAYGSGKAYCERCARERLKEYHDIDDEGFDEDDFDEDGLSTLLPVVNSPRVGVCGYTG